MIQKQLAIVLNSFDFGESSKIISVFTREKGRISLIGKGLRNPKSKLHFASQPMSILEITYYEKNREGLHLLSSASNYLPMNSILSSLEHITCAMMMLESIYHTLGENNPSEELYDYCVQVLQLLNKISPNPFNHFVASQFKLAETLGFWLQFDFMLDDDIRKNEKYAFSIEDGRPVMLGSNQKNTFIFDYQTALYMQKIFRLPLQDLYSIPVNKSSYSKIISFFEKYFSFHLERNFEYKSFNLIGLV